MQLLVLQVERRVHLSLALNDRLQFFDMLSQQFLLVFCSCSPLLSHPLLLITLTRHFNDLQVKHFDFRLHFAIRGLQLLLQSTDLFVLRIGEGLQFLSLLDLDSLKPLFLLHELLFELLHLLLRSLRAQLVRFFSLFSYFLQLLTILALKIVNLL